MRTMVFRYNDIVNALAILGDDENLRVTVGSSGKGGLIAGACTTVGGLLLGPAGLALGGVVGGALAYRCCSRSGFKSVGQVILYEMRSADQEALVRSVRNVIEGFDAGDALELVMLIQGNSVLKAKVVGEMTTFFKNALEMELN